MEEPLEKSGPPQKIAPRALRERELNWLQHNPQEIYKLSGKWVVIEGERVVSHGAELLTVIQQARDSGIETPFVIRVPAKDEEPLIV